MSGTLDNLPISTWLSELHMECYKKNLEDYDTIRPLLDLKELDLKKLGIQNSKDRARMLGSLANYKSGKENDTPAPPIPTPVQAVQESHKSLLRKTSLKKINLKGLLGSGSSKKSKKSKSESVIISAPSLATTVELDQISAPIRPTSAQPKVGMMAQSSTTADYEELPSPPHTRSMTMSTTTKAFHAVTRKAIENEYVPSPENSPRFDVHRQRSYTVGGWDHDVVSMTRQESSGSVSAGSTTGSFHYPTPVGVAVSSSSQGSTPEVRYRQQQQQQQQHGANPSATGQHTLLQSTEEGNSSPGLKNRHLSAISMESGLSFGYDVEKDFNPAFPLENQPWYHGKISRADAEALLHDDGDFLVRENTLMPNTHTLSLRWHGQPDHTLIGTTEVVSTTDITRATGFKYHFEGGAFDTIPELIYNHLKYQIPIDKTQHTLIVNPICRAGFGNKSGGQAPGIYMTMLGAASSAAATHHTPLSHGPLSPSARADPSNPPANTLPRNFGSNSRPGSAKKGTISPEGRLQLGPRITFSPRHSAHSTPSGELKSYGSSGDLLDITSSSREDVEVDMRNVISPPPTGGARERAMTVSQTSFGRSTAAVGTISPHQSPSHKKMDSFGDYEMMESVSILNGVSPLTLGNIPSSSSLDSSVSSSSTSLSTPVPPNVPGPRERVKYAEIRYQTKPDGSRGGPLFVQDSKSVKYAEIRFGNNAGNVPAPAPVAPHPFSLYDTVPPPRKQNSPYQSRAEILAQKMGDYATPNPAANRKPVRCESSPSPFNQSQYAAGGLPRTSSSSNYIQVSFDDARGGTSNRGQMPYIQPEGGAIQSLLDRAHMHRRKKDRDSTASNDSALSTGSGHSSSPGPSSATQSPSHRHTPQTQAAGTTSHPQQRQHRGRHNKQKPLANVHSHVPEAKVHKSLPGYSMLVKIHTLLQTHSNEELVYHLTRADATSFMLAPRPGEDARVWKERVKQCTSSSGQFFGLQTLADPDGEKLWKKLYFRHLNLAQTVSLCIVTAGDAMERAKLLHRFIDIASLLQSGNYGNLFSFIAVMQGMAVPQVSGMSEVWELLSAHFPTAASTHKDLMSFITNIKNGVSMYSTDQLTIPAIQHLKSVYHFSELPIPGFPIAEEDMSLVGEYSSMCTGLDGVRTIVSNTAMFSYNSRRRLDGLRYDANLMDFFMQDTIRLYLQSISVHVDDPIERRRRFGVLLDALVMRVNSSESV